MTSASTTETARGQGLGALGTIVTPFSGKLTLSAFAQNVLNTTNLVRYSGVLMSQAFGTPAPTGRKSPQAGGDGRGCSA